MVMYTSGQVIIRSGSGIGLFPPIGTRLVWSAPAATTTSAKPHMIFWLAMLIASSPEAQYLLTVMPGT